MRPHRSAALVAAVLLPTACRPGAEATRDSARAAAPVAVAPVASDPAATTFAPTLGIALPTFTRRPSGLYVRDSVVGKGAVATQGHGVLVRYTGAFADGTTFDSTHASGHPLAFVLGRGEVIKGWDEGMTGMRVGGARTLVVPPALGYGSNSPPGIPPNTVLVFRVKLVGVQ
ncbi:MAG TPA: FKBP-type peptidyl-prolyl cis-trans isomerase [Gemmatirosa sp.]